GMCSNGRSLNPAPGWKKWALCRQTAAVGFVRDGSSRSLIDKAPCPGPQRARDLGTFRARRLPAAPAGASSVRAGPLVVYLVRLYPSPVRRNCVAISRQAQPWGARYAVACQPVSERASATEYGLA